MKLLHHITIALASLCLLPAIAPAPVAAHTPTEITVAQPTVQIAQRRRRGLSWRVGVRSSRYRIGGFSRSGTCTNRARITAFVPPPRSEENIKASDGAIDLTLSAYPTFWVYLENVPTNSQVQFTLQDEFPKTADKDLYNLRFTVNKETGILGIKLPTKIAPLKVGQRYVWQMRVKCEENDLVIGSWIQRVSPDQIKATPEFDPKPFIKALAEASEADKPTLYAQLGVWQDAVTSIIALRQKQPNNQELREDWRSLLTAAQMAEFANAPLLGVK